MFKLIKKVRYVVLAMAMFYAITRIASFQPGNAFAGSNAFSVGTTGAGAVLFDSGTWQVNGVVADKYLESRGTTTLKGTVTFQSTNTTTAVPQSRIVARNASGAATGAGAVMVWASSYTAIADTNTYTAGLDVTTTTTRNALGVAGITAESIPAGSTGSLITYGYFSAILAEEVGGGGADAHTGALPGSSIITSTRPYYSGYAVGNAGSVFYSTNTINSYGMWLSYQWAATSGTARGIINSGR